MLAALLTITTTQSRPLLLIHVMPWFELTPQTVGWHWRMNKSPEEFRQTNQVASHYQPLTGPYDSTDPDLVELQVTWMKLAGFDGVLADWYGIQPHFDYPFIHKSTKLLFETATKANLKISVVWEDQTTKNALNQNVIVKEQIPQIAAQTGDFLKTSWFPKPNWLKHNNTPLVLNFGPQGWEQPEWDAFRKTADPYALLTLHNQKPFAQGTFDWPLPHTGLKAQTEFDERTKSSPIRITSAYPRFQDYYTEGGQTGYPDIPDNDGKTYTQTLTQAAKSTPFAIQVATWNDWQEGTQIEPSKELQFRDLIATQNFRKSQDPNFPYTPQDLQLPLKLYNLKKSNPTHPNIPKISTALLQGDTSTAQKLLEN